MDAGRAEATQATRNGQEPVAEAQKVAAFFDFDRTLIHGDAGVIFGRTLAAYAYAQKAHHETAKEKAAHMAAVTGKLAAALAGEVTFRGLNKLGMMSRHKLVERAYRMMKGLPAQEMYDRMGKVWDDLIRDRIYEPMFRIVREHREAGHRIVIVTTGLKPLVAHSRSVLGDDVEIIACEMGVLEGIFTGMVEGPLYGVHKAQAVAKYAAKHGIDLSKSYAYSDHESDAAFLEAVGNPVAVNPKRKLRRLATERGWKVLRIGRPRLGFGGTGA